jgi:hypothetical protein
VTINKYVPNSMTNLELITKKQTSSFGNFILFLTAPLSVGTELICSDYYEKHIACSVCITVCLLIHPLKQMRKQPLTNCSRHNPYRCYDLGGLLLATHLREPG